MFFSGIKIFSCFSEQLMQITGYNINKTFGGLNRQLGQKVARVAWRGEIFGIGRGRVRIYGKRKTSKHKRKKVQKYKWRKLGANKYCVLSGGHSDQYAWETLATGLFDLHHYFLIVCLVLKTYVVTPALSHFFF